MGKTNKHDEHSLSRAKQSFFLDNDHRFESFDLKTGKSRRIGKNNSISVVYDLYEIKDENNKYIDFNYIENNLSIIENKERQFLDEIIRKLNSYKEELKNKNKRSKMIFFNDVLWDFDNNDAIELFKMGRLQLARRKDTVIKIKKQLRENKEFISFYKRIMNLTNNKIKNFGLVILTPEKDEDQFYLPDHGVIFNKCNKSKYFRILFPINPKYLIIIYTKNIDEERKVFNYTLSATFMKLISTEMVDSINISLCKNSFDYVILQKIKDHDAEILNKIRIEYLKKRRS